MVAVKHSRLGTGQDGRLSVCDCRVDVSNADMKKENDHGQGLFLDKENLSSAANCPTQVNSIHAVCILGSLQSACVADVWIQLQVPTSNSSCSHLRQFSCSAQSWWTGGKIEVVLACRVRSCGSTYCGAGRILRPG